MDFRGLSSNERNRLRKRAITLILSGRQERYYCNGQLEYIEVIDSGVQDIIVSYEDGGPMLIGTYIDNLLHWAGEKKEYYPNGQLATLSHFKVASVRENANV